jgi:hypothetical protein
MAVRAKLRVVEMKTDLHLAPEAKEDERMTQVTVVLQPVFGGKNDEANREWSKWTPSGEVRLCITNPDAYRQFKLGQAYFLDFTPAEG